MNLRSLRIFRRVVATGSLAQASTDLNISPSAASRLLSLLESELKLTLFSRDKRRLELTAEGDRFYRQTEHILRGLDEMDLLAADIRARSSEQVSLVTAAPLAMGLVSPALALLRERSEPVDYVINVGTRFDLESRVATRAYNIGLLSLPIENGILDLTVEPFMEARLGVLMPRGHRLAERDAITAEDLTGERIVGLTKGQRWRERLDEAFAGVGLPADLIETTSTPVVKTLVQDGLGLTVVDCICGRIAEGERLVLRPLTPERWITYATIHPSGTRPARSAAFLTALRDFVLNEQRRSPDLAGMLRLT